jgi:hypothetical protein
MWTIDQLRLVLPPGFEHRAERIARRVAEELADLPVPRDLSLKSLSVPSVNVAPNAQDGEIASQIAGSIARSIASSVAGGLKP